MPLDRHEILCQKLAELADRAILALKEADPDVLMLLADEQGAVLRDLRQAGISTESCVSERLQALSRRVSDVITEIQQRRHEVFAQIKQVSDGKKMVHAYVA